MSKAVFFRSRGVSGAIVAYDPARDMAYGLYEQATPSGVIKIACMTMATRDQLADHFRQIPAADALHACPRVYAIARMMIDGGDQYVRSQAASTPDDPRSDTTQEA